LLDIIISPTSPQGPGEKRSPSDPFVPPTQSWQNALCDIDHATGERAARIAELLAATPGQAEHVACGVTARPCRDCRRTAPLPCIDLETCGITDLCRPCGATWRCRMWHWCHVRHVRAFHCAVERYPALARLHPDSDVAAAVFWALRKALRRDLGRFVRKLLAADLPDAVALLTGGVR
jgi:hypothetical protein